MTLMELARRCVAIIESAEADGLVINSGNVVDLIADNVSASLVDIRAALAVSGHDYGQRFLTAIMKGRN